MRGLIGFGVRDEVSQEQAYSCAAAHVVGKVLRLIGRNDIVPVPWSRNTGAVGFGERDSESAAASP